MREYCPFPPDLSAGPNLRNDHKEVPMKDTRYAISTLGVLTALALFGCGSEKIEANVVYLGEIGTATPSNDTWLEIIFAPDSSFTKRELRIRVDGAWLLTSPEDPWFVTLEPEGSYGPRVDNLAFSSHVFEVVEADGDVRVRTSPLNLTAGRNNQLVIYGNGDQLDYVFFANSDAELASVPEGSVLARAINVMADHPSIPLRTCPASAGPIDSIDLAQCAVVDQSFGYGKLWQAIVPRETNLAIPCDPTTPDVLCHLWRLGPSCLTGSTPIPVKASVYALTRRGIGVFPSYDTAPGGWCPLQ